MQILLVRKLVLGYISQGEKPREKPEGRRQRGTRE